MSRRFAGFSKIGPPRFSDKKRTALFQVRCNAGAVTRIRTGDLILTKDALYLLSYNSIFDSFDIIARFPYTVNCFFRFS